MKQKSQVKSHQGVMEWKAVVRIVMGRMRQQAEVGITRHGLGSLLAVGSSHPWHVAGQ